MEEIKKLRQITGAGMVDCKKALEEAGGDIEKAVNLLRKKGIAKAAKRSDREANEGIIKTKVSQDYKKGYIIEFNSETDFVARNDKFQEFADKVINLAEEKDIKDLEILKALSLEEGSVSENLDNLSGTIGEKLSIKRLAYLSGETVVDYNHLGGKIGVLVALDQADKHDLGVDIAMQVAAASPKYLKREEVKESEIAAEKDVYREQLLKEGKPEQILDKIIEGKMDKFFSEVCLFEQEFIKDDKKKIKDILDGVNIVAFVCFNLQ
jgi:elongation factor Ts